MLVKFNEKKIKEIMFKSYQVEEKKRTDQGLPSLALTPEQTAELVELLKKNNQEQPQTLIDIFVNKIPAGVDQQLI